MNEFNNMFLSPTMLHFISAGISQVTGFPVDHFSDFEINKHTEGSSYEPHFDINAANK